jgi:hypothetical protein
MAKDDVVNDLLANIASGGTATFQPSGGVECVITGLGGDASGSGPDRYVDITAGIYDGTDRADPIHKISKRSPIFKIGITNANYLIITNDDGLTQDLAYCGYQTK